jgi:tRNA pseudouridine38-40 synthase
MRFKLTIEYDGTNYSGWQVQPNGSTVQGAVEDAVSRLFGEGTCVAAAGRTDAGVHAAGQVVTFSSLRQRSPQTVRRALNALTPRDVSITAVEVVADTFDPRRDARSRVYDYRIWNSSSSSPFWRLYAWHVPHKLAVGAMQGAAAQLLGEHDFSSFRAADCDAEHPVRRLLRSDFTQHGPLLVYTVEATAFLRHMVRNIIGTLIEVGQGRRAVGDISALIGACDRKLAGPTAPAHGLCLRQVKY